MPDERTEIFEQHRKTLEGLAYRMLGTLSEAHDAVQDTYLKWHEVDIASLDSPRAWLITVCSRISLNQLQSARKQRELYIGEWLPEPFPDNTAHDSCDPAYQIEVDSTVSVALLLALENLSPMERAAFLLHDVFELSFEEVAQTLGKSSANSRQLATRARKHIHENRPRFETTPEEHLLLLNGFMSAAKQNNMEQLVSLLAADAELYSDGGGKVQALPKVLCGAKEIARFFVDIFSGFERDGTMINIQPQRFNGSHGVLIFENARLATALTIETCLGRIQRVYAVRNPNKFSGFKR